MGANHSVIHVVSGCPWIKPGIIESEIEDILAFGASTETNEELLQNLKKKICKIPSVENCTFEYHPRGFFRPRTVSMNIDPKEEGPSIQFVSGPKHQFGIGIALNYIGHPSSAQFSLSYAPNFGKVISCGVKYPLMSMTNLKENIPVPLLHFIAQMYTKEIIRFSFPTISIKTKYIPYVKTFIPSIYFTNRSFIEKLYNNCDFDFKEYFNGHEGYNILGIKLAHKATFDNLEIYGTDKNVIFNVHNVSKLFAIQDSHRTYPALKYIGKIHFKLPPNISLRGEAGSIISPQALPYPERFHLSKTKTTRSIVAQKFSPKFGRVYTGLEHYLALTEEFRFYNKNTTLSVFNTNTFGATFLKTHPAERVPAFVQMGAIGISAGVRIKPYDIEFCWTTAYTRSEHVPHFSFSTVISNID